MTDQVTRNNHYVPQWYQRGFFQRGQSQLHYLNMLPEQKTLPDGRIVSRNALHRWGPTKCFTKYDLYSTIFGPFVNDEVERSLFGPIDDKGSNAVRAFADGNSHEMQLAFEDLFEYLDAQKLRTPKGLDWIKARYANLNQMQLMQEMQALRLVHCTMWTEGVREIVSAENSDIKFIVSDHPVTTYNAACPPSSQHCNYPDDPPIEWCGTITIFALNSDTCIILSNLEYAKEPGETNLTAPRTNARYRGPTLVRTDAFIRERKLSRDEVIAINYLLKSRARQYIAASDREWLYPEKAFPGKWSDIAAVLLPKDELWQFGGEIYVGYKDGSTHYQDAFGRTSGSHEYLRKKQRNGHIGPNDSCGCGSGRKYKLCCRDLPDAERPTWEVYGIRERNLMFCNAVRRILGLGDEKSWEDVRRELSNEQVARIHEMFSSLWPEDTNLPDLLPRPTKRVLRTVYLGPSDPRTLEAVVLQWLAYFDEIVLAHPFLNSLRIRPEYSPTKSPSQHKAQTLMNVALLLALEPFIHAGWVHLIPDPGDFNGYFGRTVLHMGEGRNEGLKFERKNYGFMNALADDDRRRAESQLPREALKTLIRRRMPELPETNVEQLLVHLKADLEADPSALLQDIEPGEAGAQFRCYKGYGMESGLYIATLTGSSIYTDIEAHWQQLHLHALEAGKAQNAIWDSVVDELSKVGLPIYLNGYEIYEARRAGRLEYFRPVLRQVAEAVQTSVNPQRATQLANTLSETARRMYMHSNDEARSAKLLGRIKLSVPISGFERNDVRRLLLTYGKGRISKPVPLAMLIEFEQGAPD